MNEKEKIEIDRKKDCVKCKKLEGLGIIAKSDICRNCKYNWYQNKLIQERQAKKELEGLYFDLLNQVENKYLHESRHETAKRYIRDYHKVFNIAQEETIKHKEKDNVKTN